MRRLHPVLDFGQSDEEGGKSGSNARLVPYSDFRIRTSDFTSKVQYSITLVILCLSATFALAQPVLVEDMNQSGDGNPGGYTNYYVENAWTPLGPDDASESGFSSSHAAYTAIAVDGNDVPYVAYLNGTAIGNTTVTAKKYENGNWVTVGSGDFSAGHADFISIAIDGNNRPYVAYRDYANSAKATVQKFDGANWSVVGSVGFSASTANSTEIAIDGNNIPYIVYQDASTNFKATVQKFEGGSWQVVGGGSASGSAVNKTDIAIDGNNIPYIVYKDGGLSDKVTVQKFESGSWQIVGNAGFSTGTVDHTAIAIDGNNVPYVAYQDIGNGGGVTVQKFDGSNWAIVGSNSFSAGAATYTSIGIHSNNVPFVAYKDGTNNNEATVQQFDGNNWITVGSAGFTANEAAFPSLAIDGTGKLIVAYGSPGAYARYYLPAVVCSPPTVSFTASTVLVGTPTNFTNLSTAGAGATYSWDFDNDGNEDANTAGNTSYTYPSAGDYTATLTINDMGCIASTSVSVTVLDFIEEGIVWADDSADKIQGSALDGSNVSDLVSGITPRGIDVDMQNRKMYWVDDLTDKVQRANFDGSEVEDIITGNGMAYPYGVAIDETNRKIYWTDLTALKIRRANLDGSVVEDLITSNLASPYGIAIDEGNGKMYWTDYTLGEVRRANLDGTGVEVLISGLNQPFGIALDDGNGKIYFTDEGADKIQRADLDGNNLEDLITTGLTAARGIEINESEGKIYWTDLGTNKLQRANLDGTEPEELIINGLTGPGDLALILCDFELSLSTSTVTQGMPTPFTLSTTGLSGTPAYSWDFDNDGSEDDNTAGNTTYTYPSPGNYTAALTITNDLGCKKKTSVEVTVDVDDNLSYDDLMKRVADDREAGDGFGYSVAVNGDYAVVGAYQEEHDEDGTSNPIMNAGAAYVFKKNAGGANNWGQIKKLVASDRGLNDFFGRSVAIDGAYIVVGAEEEDQGGNDAGAAYVFKKDQGGVDNWGEVKKLMAADASGGNKFGGSVSISGDYIVVGARLAGVGAFYGGTAYIFKKGLGGTDNWGQLKQLAPSNVGFGYAFGSSVSIDGQYAVVGAAGESSNAGAAYIFKKDEGGTDNWGEVKRIIGSDTEADDIFGSQVSISGAYVLVGAYWENTNGSKSGAAYIFKKDEGGAENWGELKKLLPADGEANDFFAYRLVLHSSYALIGAYGHDDNGNDSGIAYLFRKDLGGASNWGEGQKISAVDASGGDNFGRSVGIHGNNIIVGAFFEDEDESGNNTLNGAGSIYFYEGANPAFPVTLVQFNASREGDKARLHWQTSTEQNNYGFYIQRSNDGKGWQSLGFVSGQGDAYHTVEYQFIDDNPNTGVNYYRLKQEDYDGSLAYSEIRSIYFSGAGRAARVHPNPFSTFLTIENGQGALTVYDMLGRVLEQRTITEAVYRLDTSALPDGPCLIRLQRNDGRLYTMKLVKTGG